MFRKRIFGFRERNSDFFWKSEPYELFVCEQAVVFAEALKTVDAIQQFYKASYDEQRKIVPAMADGHSGNTFGTACMLARLYIEAPDLVEKQHGALCPLVGCEEYKCF